MTRFLCCSDTHGRRPPELDEAGAAAWLHAGDAYDGPTVDLEDDDPDAPDTGWSDPLRPQLGTWVRSRTCVVFAVRGNHDTADPRGFFRAAEDIGHGAVRPAADGIWIAGLGWSGPRCHDLPGDVELSPIADAIRFQVCRLPGNARLILLTHYPPDFGGRFAPAPPGWASAAVRRLVEDIRPAAVVQGHIHQWFGRSGVVESGGARCLVISPGPQGGTLTIDPGTGAAEWSGA